jgi:hypothetical protein
MSLAEPPTQPLRGHQTICLPCSREQDEQCAEPTDQGHDIEPELVMRQGEVGLGLGPVGQEESRAVGIGAPPNREGQADDAIERADGRK